MGVEQIGTANPEAVLNRPIVDFIDPSQMVFDVTNEHGLTQANPPGDYEHGADSHNYDAVYYGPTWRYGRNGLGISVYASRGDTFDATLRHAHAKVAGEGSSIQVDSYDQRVDMNGVDYPIDQKDKIILRTTTPGGKEIVRSLTKIFAKDGVYYHPQWRQTKRVGGDFIARDEPLTPRQVRALGRLTARKFGLSYTEENLRTPGPLRIADGTGDVNYSPSVYRYVNQLVSDFHQEGLTDLEVRKKLLTTLHPDRNPDVERIEDYFSYAAAVDLGQKQIHQETLEDTTFTAETEVA